MIISSNALLILMFIGLLIGLATAHPLAWVLGGIAALAGVYGWGDAVYGIFSTKIYDTMNNYSLVAIPMFVLMANFLTASKVADGLFESIRYLLGSLKGGLGVAVILVSTIFAATTGIIGASVVTMGMLGLPILFKYKYKPELAVGVVAAGGTLGILIPPSIMLVVMGSYSELSVGRLFMCALPPGLLLSILYALYVVIVCKINPDWGPPLSEEEAAAMPVKKMLSMCMANLVPPMVLILGVLGSIFFGVATPTEASGVGAFVSLILVLLYRRFSWDMLKNSVLDTAKTTAMVFAILIGANCFTAIFIGMGGSKLVVSALEAMGVGAVGALSIYIVILFILGCFIDWTGIVMLVFPIFLPILDGFGYDRLFVVALAAVVLQSSFLTPPFGFALFFIKGIAPQVSENGIPLGTIYKGIVPFVLIILLVVAVCIIWPDFLVGWATRAKI